MSFFISLFIFLIVTAIFVVIVTCFVAVVTALFSLIVSKDENRAENSINAVLSSGVFGIIFFIGILITHFLACGTKTDFGFGDYHFVKMYNCSLERIDDGQFFCTDSCGRVVVDSLAEVFQVDSMFVAKKTDGSVYTLNLSSGLAYDESTRYVVPEFQKVGRFYVMKHDEITGTTRIIGFSLTVFLALFCAYLNFLSLRKAKNGIVSRFKEAPIISKLFN